MKKKKCDVKHVLGCTGIAISRYKGTKKGDPEFNCCLGCVAMLRRMGVRFKAVTTAKRRNDSVNKEVSQTDV